MAQNATTQKPAPTTAPAAEKRGPGRPPKSESNPAESALATLQSRLDRACALINDGPTTSIAAAIARCARAGVPRATVDKALGAVRATVSDLTEATERAYQAPAKREAPKSRVSLL